MSEKISLDSSESIYKSKRGSGLVALSVCLGLFLLR